MYLSGLWTCQLHCYQWRVRELSDFIKNILNLCSKDKWRSYRFGRVIWGHPGNFGVNCPFKGLTFRLWIYRLHVWIKKNLMQDTLTFPLLGEAHGGPVSIERISWGMLQSWVSWHRRVRPVVEMVICFHLEEGKKNWKMIWGIFLILIWFHLCHILMHRQL